MNAFYSELKQAFVATFKAIATDRAVLSVMVGAIVLYSFFYPLGYQQQVAADQPIIVVDLDQSSLSRELIRDLESIHVLKIIAVVSQESTAVDAIRNMSIQGYVVIPAGLERDILSGIPGNVALFANGAWLGRSSSILSGMADAITHFAQNMAVKQASFAGLGTQPPLTLVQRPLFNTREGYGSSVVTGVAELIIQQTLLIGLAVLAGTRRELYGRIFLTNTQMLGVSLAAVCLGVANMLYYSGFMFWYQDYPQHGNLGTVLFSSLLYISAIVAFGLFITSFFRTRERAYQIIVVTSLPIFFLSNISWPATSTPSVLVWLAQIIPATSGINLFIKVTQFGAHLDDALHEIVVLLLLIIGYGSLGWWRYRQRD